MDIEKANSYSTYIQNFNLRNKSVPGVTSPDSIQKSPEKPAEQVNPNPKEEAQSTQSVKPRGNASLADISVSFGNKDSSLLGFGTSINNMEGADLIRKEISSMQKDQVLKEYQYFVGSKVKENQSQNSDQINGNVLTSDQDGTVIKL
ncbi:MAG: hypothetical protein K6B41_04615 [Butyrivibrio sp.]|nr:hypothetical protein [Butyrivibrio sp.]